MRDRDYEGRPAHRRRTKANVWRYSIDGVSRPGVQLRIEDKSAWMTPERAYALADKLVDAAEQAENEQRAAAGSSDTA